jgi:transcriptional antiterminator RfaH
VDLPTTFGSSRGVSRMGSQGDRFKVTLPAWIVINTHAHREHMALDNLHRQDFEAYCPMIRKRRSHARRIESVLRPLFPNYLFVLANDRGAGWRPILSTHGVRAIVRAGDRLSFIDDAFIAGLKAREIDGAIVRPASPYRIGQRVQIATGPFDQMIATIIEMDERDRLVVLLDMMNRGTKVKLDSQAVAPA